MAYMKVLIDNGSQLTCITEDALKRTGDRKHMKPTGISMTSAQGSTFEVKGKINIDLQFGKKGFACDTVVTPVLIPGIDIILGNNFLLKHYTTLNTYPHKEPLFILENQVITLVKAEVNDSAYQVFNIVQEDDEILGKIRTIKPVLIPPQEEGYIKVKFPSNINKNKNKQLLFTSFDFNDLCLLEGALRAHETNQGVLYGWVKYRNYSTDAYEFPKNFVLGEVSVFETLTLEDEKLMQNGKYVNTIKVAEDRWEKIKEQLFKRIGDDPEIKERLLRVFKGHQKTVNLDNEKLSTTDTVCHKIDYFGPENNYTSPYPTPKSEREEVSNEVQRMLQHGKVEPSESCHNSPVIPIRKKSGEIRLVFDFRKINLFTCKQKFPLPRIDDILNDLYGGKVFSCLDMKSGYSQVKLHPDSRPLTAFTVPEGRYQHVVLPQGLTNAPSCFQSLMCNVVSGLAPNIFCFLDDLLIVSQNYEEHERHLNSVLERLEKHKLSIRIDKCEFFEKSVKYLGFNVGSHGISPLPEKVEAIKSFPRPVDLFQLRSFLGLTSYYRRFLTNYAEISIPLVELTKGHPKKGKRVKIEWNEEAEAAFQMLKEKMCKEVILEFPDYTKPFRMSTDASQVSMGGVLSQLDENGRERPITFFSKVLSVAEKKYGILEKEALALVFGLRQNKSIIGSFPVEVVSDNAPLVYLMKRATGNSRVVRWQAAILDFDVTNFKHLPGKLNIPADCMSRKPYDLVDDLLNDLPLMAAIRVKAEEDEMLEINWDVEEMKLDQNKDPIFKEIKKFIAGKYCHMPRYLTVPLNQFEVQNDILYYKNINAYGKERFQTCIPESYRNKALILAHSSVMSGHSGRNNTINRLKKFAFWPSMKRDAIAFVSKCEICKKYKKEKIPPIPILRNPQVTRPWQCVHADTVGPLPEALSGNKYIITFVDVLTRYAVAAAVPNKRAETIAEVLFNKVFSIFGIVENLITDRGTEFCNEVLEKALSYMKVKHRKVTAYRPSANGLVENFNKQLMNILRSHVQEQESLWDESLSLAVFAYNSGHNRTILDSPFYLQFGRDPVLPYYHLFETPAPWYNVESYKHKVASTMHSIFTKAQAFIEQGQLEQEVYRNQKARKRSLKIGDRIYVSKKKKKNKLTGSFIGPFRIEDIKGVIVFARSIATSDLIQVHSERVKLEEQISVSDCKNARSCYPVKVSEDEWLEVDEEIQVKDGLEVINNVQEEELVINNTDTLTCKGEKRTNEGYRTRSKGPATEQSWILEKV